MLDIINFKNNRGEALLPNRYSFINESDLRDYEWDENTVNNRISSFTQGIREKSVQLAVIEPDESKAYAVRDAIIDVCERDIADKKPGTFICGDWTLKAYIRGCEFENYLESRKVAVYNLSVICEDPVWYRKRDFSFIPVNEDEGDGLNFPFNFPFNFGKSSANNTISNLSNWPAWFEMVIYGPCQNPTITIAGCKYSVNATLLNGDFITISSLGDKEKRIIKTSADGTKENYFFAKNDAVGYIFKQIPSGLSNVSWEGAFGFDVSIFEKRSAPKWT